MRQCLPDPNNYHEFCRLLARLKSNYQLGELVKVENYPEVIRLIANFTVTSLQVSVAHRHSTKYNIYCFYKHQLLYPAVLDERRVKVAASRSTSFSWHLPENQKVTCTEHPDRCSSPVSPLSRLSALGVRPQQRSLPAESVAAPGGVCPVRQSHRASSVGDLHS